VAIDQAWCGVLGVSRDWMPTVAFDRVRGTGSAGGYVGSGLTATNLAARVLSDLVLERDSELTTLPWVRDQAPRWEPEPLRFIGSNLVYGLYRAADRRESESDTTRDDPRARCPTSRREADGQRPEMRSASRAQGDVERRQPLRI
jgi:hypothetical protein